MKKRKNSRAKGCSFELQVAKLVQAWYGGTWKRTPLSGGWSKGKGDFDVAGDLVCDLKHRLHVECFAGNTLVLTSEGYRKISEVCVGDRVLTHLGRFKKVTAVQSRKAMTVAVKTKAAAMPIYCTEDHPFENFQGDFQPIKEMRHTAHITKVRPLDQRHLKTKAGDKIEITKNVAKLLGLYIAEGCLSKRRVYWSFHKKERKLYSFVRRVIRKTFGVRTKLHPSETTKAIQVVANSTALAADFASWCAVGSHEQRLGKLLFLPEQLLVPLIRGAWLGDGCVRPTFARYGTVSKRLAFEMQAALFRCGVVSLVYKAHAQVHQNSVTKSPYYSVYIEHGSLTAFGLKFGFDCRHEQRNSYARGIVKDWSRNRVFMREVTQQPSRERTVYNLTVADDETYVVQGNIVVHNCKFHNKFYVEDLITGIRARGTTSILMWWEQATREAAKSYGDKPRNPLLVFKRNLGPVCIMMTEKFFDRLDKLGGGLGTLLPQLRHRIETGKYGNGPVVIMSAEVFFARMRPPKASPNHATWQPQTLSR
jgi:hypothetical protein